MALPCSVRRSHLLIAPPPTLPHKSAPWIRATPPSRRRAGRSDDEAPTTGRIRSRARTKTSVRTMRAVERHARAPLVRMSALREPPPEMGSSPTAAQGAAAALICSMTPPCCLGTFAPFGAAPHHTTPRLRWEGHARARAIATGVAAIAGRGRGPATGTAGASGAARATDTTVAIRNGATEATTGGGPAEGIGTALETTTDARGAGRRRRRR